VLSIAEVNAMATLTVKQVADQLQISLRTARELTRSGAIEVVRVGPRLLRVTPEALAEYLRSNQS
jgi:excisionase family DNA binding protein